MTQKINWKLKSKFIITAGLALWFVFNSSVHATELFFTPETVTIGLNQEFQVDLLLNVQGEAINAVAGVVEFPDQLELADVYDGNSLVSLWLEQVKHPQSFAFSGVIPGGFAGLLTPYHEAEPAPGKIITLVFKAKETGAGEIKLANAQTLLHDGAGTPASLTTGVLPFTVVAEAVEIAPITVRLDQTPPEIFRPEIVRDDQIYDGQWLLVFSTQDKGGGIDYYEVKEGNSSFVFARSPHLLKNQDLSVDLVVRAVDKAGNKMEVALPAKYPVKWYENYLVWGIIIIALAVLLGSKIYLRRKYGGTAKKSV